MKKGERALTLYMPIQLKRKNWDHKCKNTSATINEDPPARSNGLRTIFVLKRNWFVLSQTEGEPYAPEPIPNWDKATALALLNIGEEKFTMLNGHAQGYATGMSTVAVSPVAAMLEKTLFHEIAHVILGHHSDGSLNSLHALHS